MSERIWGPDLLRSPPWAHYPRKSLNGALKSGLRVLVHNCPRLPTLQQFFEWPRQIPSFKRPTSYGRKFPIFALLSDFLSGNLLSSRRQTPEVWNFSDSDVCLSHLPRNSRGCRGWTLRFFVFFWWAPRLLCSGGVLVEVVFFENCRVTTLLCISA